MTYQTTPFEELGAHGRLAAIQMIRDVISSHNAEAALGISTSAEEITHFLEKLDPSFNANEICKGVPLLKQMQNAVALIYEPDALMDIVIMVANCRQDVTPKYGALQPNYVEPGGDPWLIIFQDGDVSYRRTEPDVLCGELALNEEAYCNAMRCAVGLQPDPRPGFAPMLSAYLEGCCVHSNSKDFAARMNLDFLGEFIEYELIEALIRGTAPDFSFLAQSAVQAPDAATDSTNP
jgi:hypothetical protein